MKDDGSWCSLCRSYPIVALFGVRTPNVEVCTGSDPMHPIPSRSMSYDVQGMCVVYLQWRVFDNTIKTFTHYKWNMLYIRTDEHLKFLKIALVRPLFTSVILPVVSIQWRINTTIYTIQLKYQRITAPRVTHPHNTQCSTQMLTRRLTI